MKIKQYCYDGENKCHIGVIAQDVQKLPCSEMFVCSCPDGYLGVNFSELVFPLIAAVQQLKTELDALKKGKK